MLQQIMDRFESSRNSLLLRIRPVVARIFDIKDKTKTAEMIRLDRAKLATGLIEDNLFYFVVSNAFLILLEQIIMYVF